MGGSGRHHLVIHETPNPINKLPSLVMGSQPIDNQLYIFSNEERREFLDAEPKAEPFLRPYVGAQELLSNKKRWILTLHDASPALLEQLPLVRDRMRRVVEFRRKSSRAGTNKLAETPTQWQLNVVPNEPFIVIPGNSSSNREYVPLAYLHPPIVPSNALYVLSGASLPTFGILSSAMHMCWLDYIGGRLGDGYRYSAGIVFNTFPLPRVSQSSLERITPFVQEIFRARAQYKDSTLGQMYTSLIMPTDLRRAHRKLDSAVDRLYRKSGFTSNQERFEFLMKMYEEMIAPLSKPGKGRRRKKSKSLPSKGE